MAQITMSEMLKAGVHFGHQTRRWNPKMKQYILMERNGIHIINLFKSLELIDKAYDFIKATVAHNGTVLFVGTKKQAQEAVSAQATRVNMPYVSERWLGGMLTNFQTVSKRVNRLKELEEMDGRQYSEKRQKGEVPDAGKVGGRLTRAVEKAYESICGSPSRVYIEGLYKELLLLGGMTVRKDYDDPVHYNPGFFDKYGIDRKAPRETILRQVEQA